MNKNSSPLDAFFRFVLNQGVEHCVLHPFVDRGYAYSDEVDVFIPKEWMEKVKQYLEANHWKRIPNYRFAAQRAFYCCTSFEKKIVLDITNQLALYSRSEQRIYQRRPDIQLGPNGVSYLSDTDGFWFLLEKEKIRSAKRVQRVQQLENLRPLGFEGSVSARIDNEGVGSRFIRSRVNRISISHLISSLWMLVSPATAECVVSFVGDDGSGKTTQADALMKYLLDKNFSVKRIYLGHGQYHLTIIPLLMKLEKGRGRFLQLMFRLVRTLLLPIEFLVRRGVHEYDVIITDRHPMFEPIAYGNSRWSFYNSLICKLSPAPHLVIYLSGDSETVWARKKEFEFVDFSEKSEATRRVVNSYKRDMAIVEISSTQFSQEATLDRIVELVMAALENQQD